MINSYLVDEITIVRDAFDEWGASTRSEQTEIKAYITDTNKLITDQNGKQVMGLMNIIIDPDEDILYTDRILITKRLGEAVDIAAKEFEIKKLGKMHKFEMASWEIDL